MNVYLLLIIASILCLVTGNMLLLLVAGLFLVGQYLFKIIVSHTKAEVEVSVRNVPVPIVNKAFPSANDINELKPTDMKLIKNAIYNIGDVLVSNNILVEYDKITPLIRYIRIHFRIKDNSYQHSGTTVFKTPDEAKVKSFVSTIARRLKLDDDEVVYTHNMKGYNGIVFTIPRQNIPVFLLGDILYTDKLKEFVRKECKKGKKWLNIPIVLGLDDLGVPLYRKIDQNLTHLLVAGSSGSGKTIGAKVILYSAMHLMKEALEVWMVDIKQTEFRQFNDYNFLSRGRYITNNMEEVSKLITDAMDLMTERQKIFVESGVNDIQSYNEKMPLSKQMRHVLLYIDELQPIYAYDKANKLGIYNNLEILATQARSSGIVMCLCTQRPDKDIVPKNLKANIGGRVGLRTQTHADSRIIINTAECSALLGDGDAILNANNKNTHFQFPLLDADVIDKWFETYGYPFEESCEEDNNVLELPYKLLDK